LFPRPRRETVLTALVLVLLAVLAAVVIRGRTAPLVAWPDEFIYLVGARNVAERGSLDTSYYLSYSLVRRGYPHRDVHMPGYILALAPFVKKLGTTWEAGALLNVLLYVALTLLVYAFALGVLADARPAALAAALFLVLPPFAGYLYVIYPELLGVAVAMAGLAWLVHARGVAGAAVAGVLFASGALVRETLLLAAPLYVARLPRRELLRGFLPAALATLVLVVAPLSRNRAVHPNALYPSVLEEARASDAPVSAFGEAIWKNVRLNLTGTAAARPLQNAEDAVLLFLALLAVAGVGMGLRNPATRRMALGVLAGLGLLTFAVLTLYVVRERGGVWGGVRVYMPWAPVLLVLAVPALFRPGNGRAALPLALTLALAFSSLDLWQIDFFNRYKASDLEDQERQANYIARYVDHLRPHRVAARTFTYSLTHYPVETIWSLPRTNRELWALEQAVPFDILAFHEKNPLRFVLMNNPRYVRLNKDDRGAEFLVWRRLF
jgi:hypothetical protein